MSNSHAVNGGNHSASLLISSSSSSSSSSATSPSRLTPEVGWNNQVYIELCVNTVVDI